MRWQPVHDAHSIERASVSFLLSEAITAKPWQTILDSGTDELDRLGYAARPDPAPPMPLLPGAPQGFQIMVGPGLPLGAPGGGRSFQRVEGGEVRGEVTLHRNAFLLSSTAYEGWSAFLTTVRNALFPLLQGALEYVSLVNVKMEYWNRFSFEGSPGEADFRELLQPSSKYLPGFISDVHELWHCHTGHFIPCRAPASKRLLNVNVDVVDIADVNVEQQPPTIIPRRSVGLYSMVQDTIDPSAAPSDPDEMASTLDDMHTILKDVISGTITAEAAERISLRATVAS